MKGEKTVPAVVCEHIRKFLPEMIVFWRKTLRDSAAKRFLKEARSRGQRCHPGDELLVRELVSCSSKEFLRK